MEHWVRRLGWLVAAWAVAGPAGAGELSVSYASIDRILWQTLLTDGGRFYLEGDANETCRYAFVQEPKGSAAGERLRIGFVFSGRAGAVVAGRCVGVGDTLQLEIEGVPEYRDGELRLRDLTVRAPDTAYFKLIRPLVERQMSERLRFPIRKGLEQWAALASAAGLGILEVADLRLAGVEVTPQGLRLQTDVDLSLR